MTVSDDESFIASTYYESMRDNFEGYAWDIDPADSASGEFIRQRAAELEMLKQEFKALDPLDGNRPSLGQLFQIELALIRLIPDIALRARYWTIEDRFHRVVPKSVARSFLASLANPPSQTITPEELRQRARNLLDVIHANYHINLAREVLIRRLMKFLAVLAGILIAISTSAAIAVMTVKALLGLLLIIVVGMAGAMISTIQRLQNATSRDAMVDDGIFELIGLRIGGVGIIMSVGMGGVSALFIYALVAAGLLDSVLPQLAGEAAGGGAAQISVCGQGDPCAHWADETARALGLAERSDLFKLTVYAFASGFAERLVPDIINKLAKDAFPSATRSSPSPTPATALPPTSAASPGSPLPSSPPTPSSPDTTSTPPPPTEQ